MFCFQGPPPPPAGKALLNFEGTEPGELRCGEGDAVVLQRRGDELWYHGLLPAGFVQSVRPLPPAPPQGKALQLPCLKAPCALALVLGQWQAEKDFL